MIVLPSCEQDFHLVMAQKEVMTKFHWLHNKDEHAEVGAWSPVSFIDALDSTKRRTITYTSQLNIPVWLQKILGGPAYILRSRHDSKHGAPVLGWTW